jgi:hypothetical protein
LGGALVAPKGGERGTEREGLSLTRWFRIFSRMTVIISKDCIDETE